MVLGNLTLMMSSPEKDPNDPVMCGSGHRPTKQYGATVVQKMHTVALDEPQFKKKVCSHQCRMAWDAHGWDRFTDEMKDRLVRNLWQLVPSSHMTGTAPMERLLHKITTLVNSQLTYPLAVPKTVHACDNSKQSWNFVSQFIPSAMPEHFHHCQTDRWPHWLWLEIQRMLPESDDYPAARRMAHAQIHAKLVEYYSQFGDQDVEAPCLVHDKPCPLYNGKFSQYIGDDPCNQGGLHMNFTGIPCDDITNWGGRNGDAGKTAVIHSAYSAERGFRREDSIIVECTPNWIPDGLHHCVIDTHSGFVVMLDGPPCGDFMRRLRKVADVDREETVCPFCF